MKLLLILVFSTCALAYNVQRNRVVGGNIASAGQFPYQISQRGSRKHLCGGSIINQETILTAAHCVYGQNPSLMNIVVGALTLDDGVWHDVSNAVMHENYDTATSVDDIAVIKLQTLIQYTWNVQPIEIDTNYINTGAATVIAGWGYTKYPAIQPSYDLLFFYGRVYDWDSCKKQFEGEKFPVLESNICSFSKDGQGVCKGDSGGGLVVSGKHVGIASWVRLCALGDADVFTRTSSYVDWIKRH